MSTTLMPASTHTLPIEHTPHTPRPAPPSPSARIQRKTMSITQTYFLAHKARAKLSSQAARPDHDLRLLVGHANLLDTLMLELADAEREQESWFNQSVRGASTQNAAPAAPAAAASPAAKEQRRVQWADATIVEEESDEEDWEADDSDVSSDASSDFSDEYDEDEADEDDSESSLDLDMADAAPLQRVASRAESAAPSPVICVTAAEDEDDVAEDDEEDFAQLSLTRSPSHSALPSPTSPPELLMEDEDTVSEDEAMPPSPPVVPLASFTAKAPAPAAKYEEADSLYLPARNAAQLDISVY